MNEKNRKIKEIEKKILPKYFREVIGGMKRFELRKDEDDIQVGDRIKLREWDHGEYTGAYIYRYAQYILRDAPQYGLMEGYCIIGLCRPDEMRCVQCAYYGRPSDAPAGEEDCICRDEDNNGKPWFRPYDMFVSEVDHEKYPDVKQKWRFEKLDD